MKVISWDVGIKNLAYCILEKTDQEYKIKEWDSINLLEEKDYKCTQNLLTRKKNAKVKVCNKKARFVGINKKKKKIYYCGNHKVNHDTILEKAKKRLLKKTTKIVFQDMCDYDLSNGNQCIKTVRNQCGGKKYCHIHIKKVTKDNNTKINNYLCCYETKKNTCGKYATYKIKDNSYCEKHKDKIISLKEKEYQVNIVTKKSSMREKLSLIAGNMYKKLNTLPNILQVDQVLIESQPTNINPAMKTVGAVLFGYFIMKGVTEKEITKSTIKEVKFISPTNKLRVDQNKTLAIVKSSKGATKYKLTKKLGIEYTNILLSTEQKWKEHLSSYKKKDDLCDAFLQGYYYMYKNYDTREVSTIMNTP
jgi:hypothetical protein